MTTQRGDGYSTYRRVGDSGRIQRAHNLSIDEENPYSLPSDYPATRQHWPLTSHSFDFSDTAAAKSLLSVSVSLLIFSTVQVM